MKWIDRWKADRRARAARRDALAEERELERQARLAEHREQEARLAEAKRAILAGVDAGQLVPFHLRNSPFRLMKSEELVYACPATYGKTGREYRATSQGASIRVMKGVSYRVGGSRGRTVDTPISFDDPGALGVTTKHLYFASSDPMHGKSFRVRLDKIVTTSPFTDGMTFMRDLASAKPEGFSRIDGVFVNDLVGRLSVAMSDGVKFELADPEVDENGENITTHLALSA